MKTLRSILALALLAGCGATLWPTLTATTPASARQAIACANQQVTELGYSVRSKRGDTWLEARKDSGDEERVAYNVMRQYDVLWIEAKNEGQAGAALRVQARSFTDTSTRRGPTPNQEYARDAVVKDAHTVIDKCGGEGAVLSS